MAKNKYLRKSEFRYDTNPEVKNPRGEGHVAYVTVRNKKRSKINIITHSKSFYGEPTYPLSGNPNPSKSSKRPSYYSVPRWERNSYLTDEAKGVWRMSKENRKRIRKTNKKYGKRNGK